MATTTFGNTSHTASAPGQANRAWASMFTVPVTGTITAIKVYTVSGGGGSVRAKNFVCANSAGLPGTVLAVTAAFVPTNSTFVGNTLSQSVTSGDVVWLGVVSKSGGYPGWGLGYNAAFKLSRKESFSYATPPASFGTPTENDVGQSIAIYATLTYGSSTVTVTLTGNQVTAAQGVFSLKRNRAIAGVGANAQQGIAVPSARPLVAGIASGGNAGLLQAERLLTLPGASALGNSGIARPSHRLTVSGNSVASEIGALSLSIRNAIAGLEAHGRIGQFVFGGGVKPTKLVSVSFDNAGTSCEMTTNSAGSSANTTSSPVGSRSTVVDP